MRGLGQIVWSSSDSFHADRHSVLRPARRDPGARRHRRAHLQGARRWLSWLPGGLIHANIAHGDAVLGDLRLVGRHRRDGRHRRHAPGRAARLRSAAVFRRDRGRRHARHPDSALDQPDRLRLPDRDLDPAAVSRRAGSRALDGGRLHGRHRPDLRTHPKLGGPSAPSAGTSGSPACAISCRSSSCSRSSSARSTRLGDAHRIRRHRRRHGLSDRRRLSAP